MEINIFFDIDKYNFNFHNLRLDLTTKLIVKSSIQQQYNLFCEKYNELKQKNNIYKHVYGIFSINPLEHCLINHYLQSKNNNSSLNKYNETGLIRYLFYIGFTANLKVIEEQLFNFDPSINKINYTDHYFYKLSKC